MGRELFSKETVAGCAASLNIPNLSNAAIADVLNVAVTLEARTGIPFIRMDQGIPGLPASRIGVEAEKKALDEGVANKYPPQAGLPALKSAASRFVKAFLDVDVSPQSCIPGVGSALLYNHCPRSLNQLTPLSQPAYFGITPASIYPHSFAHQLTKQAHHSTRELKPYQDQYGSPPIVPIWESATVTI